MDNKNPVNQMHSQGLKAVDETRTRDLHLGKVALYQLSYYRRMLTQQI